MKDPVEAYSMLIPTVIETTNRTERGFDIFSRLLRERIIFHYRPDRRTMLRHSSARSCLFLEAENPSKEISLYINSPGGLVTAGLAIYDTMQFIKPEITTICIGQAASMGSLLLGAGEKGSRFCLPNSRIMLHQPSAGFRGQASDIHLHAQEVLSLKRRLNDIYVKHTGNELSVVEHALERDNFMTAERAKEFGLIDKVISSRASLEADA